MRRRAVILAASTVPLGLLSGCGSDRRAGGGRSATAEATSTASWLPPPTPAPGYAPDGTQVPGGKPTWLATLPDPADVDRKDPEAVIRAYVTTAGSWDTTVDRTSAYATQRAAIYQTAALREAAADYDPDTAKAQGEFIEAAQYEAYTTVTIRDVTEEGVAPDQDGDYRRIVHYLVRTTPRQASVPTSMTVWDAWVSATQEDGQWAITSMHTQSAED
ncbi:hypothetical protein [Actinomyces wuliandei]|uniref:hypothetical protein n=1 Tax=Actinomyces wuliandei TaxID=2057743 RepID=UPI001119DFFA|nr:hypothetical protein [Actinomyces wuliandei]